jgi:hypothetical protein
VENGKARQEVVKAGNSNSSPWKIKAWEEDIWAMGQPIKTRQPASATERKSAAQTRVGTVFDQRATETVACRSAKF